MESARLVWVTFSKKTKLIFLVGSECKALGLFLEYAPRNYFKLAKQYGHRRCCHDLRTFT